MKQYKIYLPILIVSLLILLVPRETFAATLWNWTEGNNIKQTDFLRYGLNCHNGSCTDYSSVGSYDYNAEDGWFVANNSTTIYKEYQFYGIEDISFSNNNQRDMIIIRTPNDIVRNYSYALSVYMCSSGTNGLRIREVYVGNNYNELFSLNGQGTILSSGFYVLPNRPFVNQPEVIWNTCRKMTLSFQTDIPGAYVGFTINNGSSSMATQDLYFLGYSFNELGYINYATQEDITSIQNAISSMSTNYSGIKQDTTNILNDTAKLKTNLEATRQEAKATNDTLNNDTVNESDNYLQNNIVNNSAFNQDHGITAIIQAPLNFIQSLNNKTCSSIVLPIPNLGNATIPCMSTIYNSKFSNLYNILKIIINGILCYRMALSCVIIVKGAKNPNEDKIEVMDL